MTRPVLLWWGIGAILAAIVVGIVVTGPVAPVIDSGWNALMVDVRGAFLIGVAGVFDRIGGGWIASYLIPLVILAALLLARRWRAAVFVAVTLLVSRF